MTLTVELKPEVEAGLHALARAKGVPLEAYLRSLLEQFAAPSAGPEMTPDQRAAAFEEWAGSFPDTPPLSDEAISRDAIYRREDGTPR